MTDPAVAVEQRQVSLGRITRTASRFFWFGLAPAVFTVSCLYALVPSRSQARGSHLLRTVALGYERFDIAFAVGFFMLATLLVNHWRHHLPGGHHLDSTPRQSGPWGTAKLLLATVLVAGLAIFVRARIVESHQVISASMLPTLLPSDRLMTEKFAYASPFAFSTNPGPRSPSRGDVVVFPASTPTAQQSHLVKRVVGIAGDRIEVRMGSVSINDWKIPSCNAGAFINAVQGHLITGRIAVEFLGDQTYLTIKVPEDSAEGKYTVLPNEVFVLGDNRGFSEDSRIWAHGRSGGVSVKDIEGRVHLVLFGRDGAGKLNLSRLLAPLKASLPFAHLDTKALSAAVEACIKNRPAVTTPPAVAHVF